MRIIGAASECAGDLRGGVKLRGEKKRTQDVEIVRRRGSGEELRFGGGACSCKSGGEPPHSKIAEELGHKDFADMGATHCCAPTRKNPERGG
jgi:hypothetical protein